MPPARRRNAHWRGCGAAQPRQPPPRWHRASTATGDPRAARALMESFRLLLAGLSPQRLFGFFDVLQRQLAGLDEPSHQRPRAAAEESQQLVDEAALRVGPRNR